MAKQELTALSLRGEINANHRECVRAGKETIHHAIGAGELLEKVKDLLPHGEFQKWVKQYCDFSHDVANGYMKLHKQMSSLSKSERARILTSSQSVSGLKRLLEPRKNGKSTPKGGPSGGKTRSHDSGSKSGSDDTVDAEFEVVEKSPAEQAKKAKQVTKAYIDKAVRAMGDYHELKPNRRRCNELVKLLQRVGENIW